MPNDSGLRVPLFDAEVAALALEGLRQQRKTLPSKLFYDERGCHLFYEITRLPEYYLTRVEHTLLPQIAADIAASSDGRSALVEYGASDEAKAMHLLRLNIARAYVPIDVAGPALRAMRGRLRVELPGLQVYPIIADFTGPIQLPGEIAGMPRLGFFPGSTIGNLEPPAAIAFLRQVRHTLRAGCAMLVGTDLRKSPEILLPAYNDSAGVTAAFNRNILSRLNREAGADFDQQSFKHLAIWNNAESRIEMHLVSSKDQTVRVAGHAIVFRRDETIHTENSYKWTPDQFRELASGASWNCPRMWMDADALFGVYLLHSSLG